jgi:hypothetical protein
LTTKIKPTPGLPPKRDRLSKEGSSNNDILLQKKKISSIKIKPTPNPSREGSPEEGTLCK